MSFAKRPMITYNASLGAGERGEIKAALLASTSMSADEIQTVFEQLDAYPSDRAAILRDINKVLNSRSITVVYIEGPKWQDETADLVGGGKQNTKDTLELLEQYKQENTKLRYKCKKYKTKYQQRYGSDNTEHRNKLKF